MWLEIFKSICDIQCALQHKSIGLQLCMLFFIFARLKHAQQELKKKEGDLKKTEQGYKKDKDAYEKVQQALHTLEVCWCFFIL